MHFNRISVLQLSGQFSKIKVEDKYVESKCLKIKAYFKFFIAISAITRIPLSQFLDQNDSRQLFIGNFFNHLNLISRFYLSIAGN